MFFFFVFFFIKERDIRDCLERESINKRTILIAGQLGQQLLSNWTYNVCPIYKHTHRLLDGLRILFMAPLLSTVFNNRIIAFAERTAFTLKRNKSTKLEKRNVINFFEVNKHVHCNQNSTKTCPLKLIS